jgi:hypothetical protein
LDSNFEHSNLLVSKNTENCSCASAKEKQIPRIKQMKCFLLIIKRIYGKYILIDKINPNKKPDSVESGFFI